MSNRESLLGIFSVVYRWRKAITSMCVAALLISVAVALWLPNYYQSTTIFYPASPKLADPAQIFGVSSDKAEIFGTDRDLDRLAEIANGSALVDYMVQKFKLYEHYGIDSTSNEGRFYVRETFLGYYDALKNKNDAIEIIVEDQDPQMAANMANAAREYVDRAAQNLNKQSQAEMLKAFQDNITHKKQELITLADSLRYLQSHFNIYSNGTQGERLSFYLNQAEADMIKNRAKLEILENNPLIPADTIQYIKANLRAAERQKEKLLSVSPKDNNLTLPELNEGTPTIQVISDLHYQARKQLSFDIERYNQLLAAYNAQFPMVHVIREANVPLMKSRPHRSMMVIASLLGALLFSVLGVLLIEAYQDVDWKRLKSEA